LKSFWFLGGLTQGLNKAMVDVYGRCSKAHQARPTDSSPPSFTPVPQPHPAPAQAPPLPPAVLHPASAQAPPHPAPAQAPPSAVHSSSVCDDWVDYRRRPTPGGEAFAYLSAGLLCETEFSIFFK